MDEQMITDIARAIRAASIGYDDWDTMNEAQRNAYLAEARAAHSVMAGKVAELTEALLHCKLYAYRVSSHSDGHPFDRDNAQAVVDIADAALAPYPERRSE